MGEGLVGKVIQTGKLLNYNNAKLIKANAVNSYYQWYISKLPSKKIDHYLAVPIYLDTKLIGVIRSINKITQEYKRSSKLNHRGFAVSDYRYLETVANIITLAYQINRLFNREGFLKKSIELLEIGLENIVSGNFEFSAIIQYLNKNLKMLLPHVSSAEIYESTNKINKFRRNIVIGKKTFIQDNLISFRKNSLLKISYDDIKNTKYGKEYYFGKEEHPKKSQKGSKNNSNVESKVEDLNNEVVVPLLWDTQILGFLRIRFKTYINIPNYASIFKIIGRQIAISLNYRKLQEMHIIEEDIKRWGAVFDNIAHLAQSSTTAIWQYIDRSKSKALNKQNNALQIKWLTLLNDRLKRFYFTIKKIDRRGGKFEYEPKRCNISRIIHDVVLDIELLIQAKDQNITIKKRGLTKEIF